MPTKEQQPRGVDIHSLMERYRAGAPLPEIRGGSGGQPSPDTNAPGSENELDRKQLYTARDKKLYRGLEALLKYAEEEGFKSNTNFLLDPKDGTKGVIALSEIKYRYETASAKNLKESEAKKTETLRNWRKGVISSWTEDQIEKKVNQIETALEAGRSPSETSILLLEPGKPVTVSQAELLKELLLARLVHQTPEDAAAALRPYEFLVTNETDALDKQYTAGRSKEIFARGLSVKDYLDKLDKVQKLIDVPLEVKVFSDRLRSLEEEYGKSKVERMAKRVRRHKITGQMPHPTDLPFGIPLEEAEKVLRRYMPLPEGVDPELWEKYQLEQDEMQRKELAQQIQLSMPREVIGGESYIEMYEKSWREFIQAFLSFPPQIQDEIVLNFIVDGCILGGQFAGFHKRAISSKGRLPSKYTAFLEAIDHVQKAGKIEGYVAMDQLFQMLGSTRPEVLALPHFHVAHHELQFAGEDQPRKFTVSSRELIGVIGSLETMSRLGVNDAFNSSDGFYAVRNGELAAYLFRKMGFDPERTRAMVYGKRLAPSDMIRDNKLSPVTRYEVDNIGDWIGETALAKLVVAMAWLKWARYDLESAPLDMKRRALLSLRGLEISAYRLGYAIGMPPEQFLSMIAVFGSAISIDHKPMLRWVRDRFDPQPPVITQTRDWQDGKIRPADLSPQEREQWIRARKKAVGFHDEHQQDKKELETEILRGQIWDQTITLNRPDIASTREMAKIVQGLGKYNKTGDDYRKVVKDGMDKLPSGQVAAIRFPELWKHRWFENCETYEETDYGLVITHQTDPSEWRYIGHLTGGPSQTKFEETFAGYDFTAELEACGLSQPELDSLEKSGFAGWKNLLSHANLSLLDWSKMGYTTGDKNVRYEHKKEGLQDSSVKLFGTSTGREPRSLSVVKKEDARPVGSIDPEIKPQVFEEELTKIFNEILGAVSGTSTFVPNETQKAYCQAVIKMYMEGHCAHSLDAYVEDLELKNLKEGDNFSVALLTKTDIPVSRIPALMQAGFYFQRDPDKGIEFLISPLCAPVPKLVTAETLLTNIETMLTNITTKGKTLSSRQIYLQKAVNFMLNKKKKFCWDTLISGSADVPVGSLIRALRESKIANFSGATYHAIQDNIVKFALQNKLTGLLEDLRSEQARIPKLVD